MKKLTVRLCLLFILAAGVLTPVWQSHAFVTFGIMDQFHTQQFWVNPNFNSVTDPNAGTAAQQLTAIQNGAADWNGNADHQFTFGGQTAVAAVNPNDGIDAVFYSDNVGDPMFGALAICFLFADAKNFITSFDIEFYDFNGQTFNDFLYFGLPAPALPAFNEFDIWGIATHEFGHALGLDHTQFADNTITMFPSIAPGSIVWRTLHVDDINGIQNIYGPPPFVAKFAGVQVFCPGNINVPIGTPTNIGGWTITNTGNVPDCFNWVLTDGGAGVLVGDPVMGQTPLLQPGGVFNVPNQTAQFNCGGGPPPGPIPVTLTATSAGNPAVMQACQTILTPTGGAAIPQALINGQPTGLAFDQADNLYVGDIANNQILFWNAGAYNVAGAALIPGIPAPTGIAIAPNGNLFVLQGDGAVSEWTIPGGAPVGFVMPPGSFAMPMDLAFCGNDLFVTDAGPNALWCIPNAGLGTGNAGIPVPYVAGLADIFGVAVDPAGNIFVTEGVTGNIIQFPAGTTALVNWGNVLGGGHAGGIAIDVAGNVYVAEGVVGADIDVFGPGGGVPIATFPMTTSGWTWISFSSNMQVHPPTMRDSFLYASNTGNIGPPNCCAMAICMVDVSLGGFVNGEAIPSAGSCTKPWAGNIYVGSPPLSGNQPSGIAFDLNSGNLFSADCGAGTVDVTAPNAAATGNIISGLDTPQGVAIGPNGLLYICEAGSTGTVSVYDLGGAYLFDQFPTGTFGNPTGLAWCGNSLFVTDRSNGTLYVEANAVGGPQGQAPLVYQSGFTDLFDVAVDFAGLVYVSTGTSGTVEMILPGPGGGFQNFATIGGIIEGIATDVNGSIWAADGQNGDIYELQNGSGTVLQQIPGLVDGPAWLAFGQGFMPGVPDTTLFWSNKGGENVMPPVGTGTIAFIPVPPTQGFPIPTLGNCVMTASADNPFAGLPLANRMLAPYPNPFSSDARIAFSNEEAGNLRLTIYDIAGRRVKTLVNEWREAGNHQVWWDGRNESGQDTAPGLYFARYENSNHKDVRKLLKVR